MSIGELRELRLGFESRVKKHQNQQLKGVFALELFLTQGLACRLGRRFAICWEHSPASVLLVASDGIARHTDL